MNKCKRDNFIASCIETYIKNNPKHYFLGLWMLKIQVFLSKQAPKPASKDLLLSCKNIHKRTLIKEKPCLR